MFLQLQNLTRVVRKTSEIFETEVIKKSGQIARVMLNQPPQISGLPIANAMPLDQISRNIVGEIHVSGRFADMLM